MTNPLIQRPERRFSLFETERGALLQASTILQRPPETVDLI